MKFFHHVEILKAKDGGNNATTSQLEKVPEEEVPIPVSASSPDVGKKQCSPVHESRCVYYSLTLISKGIFFFILFSSQITSLHTSNDM